MEHLSLRAGGRQASREEWERAAAAVLRKSGRMTPEDPDELVWDTLTRTTLDGIGITPLGTQETVPVGVPAGLPGQAPYTRGSVLTRSDEGWDVRAHLADPDPRQAAADALLDLENGATSLWVVLGPGGIAPSDLGAVLERVHLDLAPVVLDCPDDPVGAAVTFTSLLENRAVVPAAGTNLGGDPVGAALRALAAGHDGTGTGDPAEVAVRLAELAGRHRTLALTVDATALHDAGGTDAQELGYSLATGAAYLRALAGAGLDVAAAAELVEFRYAATDEQLPTIAKLRAGRRLWHRVLELSGVPGAPGQRQHAVTSRPMTTRYDPYVNMLRGTVAAFAAGVGGAASVTVLPFDSALGLPDALARRNARNTSSLLIHEAHLARVTDPAGGAFAVERLTEDLARAGWAQFQQIERDGGVVASLRSGALLERVRSHGAVPRSRQVATRGRPLTGVSEFPNLEERLLDRRPHPQGSVERAVARYAQPFEALRDDPPSRPVFLATMGTLAQHTARAGFAANLLAAGGVTTVAAGATSGPADVVAAYRQVEPPTSVVCLAGTDAAYAEWAADLVAELREAGATYVILAGRPGELAVDDSCAVGVDALAFLHRVRTELSR